MFFNERKALLNTVYANSNALFGNRKISIKDGVNGILVNILTLMSMLLERKDRSNVFSEPRALLREEWKNKNYTLT